MSQLINSYDAALFDLDGVIYLGPKAIEGVPEVMHLLRTRGTRIGFVTNNASRTPATVADHLRALEIQAEESDVVNATQATLRMMREDLPEGARILILGTEALATQVREYGFHPVHKLEDEPVAVVQGYNPGSPWSLLELGAMAIQGGAAWYATNPDMTRPTERGILPGCGAQVAVVQACVDVEPKMAGKPFRPLMDETVLRLGAERPIFVGDRTDTDILGANTVGMDSLFVFTGAHGKRDLAAAVPEERPTHIGSGIGALLAPARVLSDDGRRCGGAEVEVRSNVARLVSFEADLEGQLDALWALLHAGWNLNADITEALDQLTGIR